jgi:nucleoside-diphosphate-sugar epimerase
MKKVLVTGATGFIGRRSLPILKDRGYQVYAISSRRPAASSDGMQWIEFDLLGPHSIKELIKSIRPSHLLHFAWVTSPGKLWGAIENLQWLKASVDLIEAFALNGGQRAVFSGTCAEYDWGASTFIESQTPCHPRTVYGSSKLALHLVLQSLAKEMGFSQAWGRIFYLYGPNEYPQRFVPAVIRGLLQKVHIPCSHGNQIRDFLHVQDVADAFAALLDSQLEGTFNIGSGIGFSLKQIIEKITASLGGKDLVQFDAVAVPKDDPASIVASTKRLNDELHWKPRFTLEEGLNDTISWWKDEMGCGV